MDNGLLCHVMPLLDLNQTGDKKLRVPETCCLIGIAQYDGLTESVQNATFIQGGLSCSLIMLLVCVLSLSC